MSLSKFLYLFLIFWGAITPLSLDYFSASYLTGFFLVFAIVVVSYGLAPSFNHYGILLFYILSLCVVFAFHSYNLSSVINIFSMMVSFFSIAVLAWYSAFYVDFSQLTLISIRSMYISVTILFVSSVVVTALNLPGAPLFYPWESFFTESRMILVTGGAGHTNQLWLLTWIAIFLIAKESTNPSGRLRLFASIIFIVLLVFMTKTRLSIFFAAVIFINYIAFFFDLKNFTYSIIINFMILISAIIYFGGVFSPAFSDYMASFLYDLQEFFSLLRVSPGEGNLVFTGRDFLNQSLINHWLNAPWFGLGNDDPIFIYGVNLYGEPAEFGEKIAGCESGLNVLAKYGVMFFLSTILVMISPLLASSIMARPAEFRLQYSIVAVSLFTFIFNGFYLAYYNLSSVAMYFTLLFYFRAKAGMSLEFWRQ